MMKDIPGYEGEYAITENGKLWSYRWNRWMRISITNGYYKVNLSKDGKSKLKYVHRLLAEIFILNPECKDQVDHIDGNKLNNNLSNLRWTTHAENQHNRKRAKGYSWHKTAQKWKAEIKTNNEKIHLGCYETEEEARQAYLDAKKIHHPTSPIK